LERTWVILSFAIVSLELTVKNFAHRNATETGHGIGVAHLGQSGDGCLYAVSAANLEKALASETLETESEALLRSCLWRARLNCLWAEQAISRLESPRLRLLLSARYLEGLNWREMADRFSLSESRLYQLHRMALALLENATPAQSGRSEPGPY
jgi:DNA-directed RNA polymerase specialized sigma24 family protein